MSAPVIDPESSVLSYPQWLTWAHQFSATGAPYDWAIVAGNFPPGMSFQPSLSVTGTSSGNTINATGNPFYEGAAVVFRSVTSGGGSLTVAVNTIYYVINWATDSFQLSTTPGGSVQPLGADISAALIYQPGYLSGSATTPGIFTVQLTATGAGGTSTPATLWTIGIEPAAAVPDSNADIVWDFATNSIIAQTSATLNLTPANRTTPILFVKEQDDLICRLRLVKNGSVIAPTMVSLKLVLKELEPENQVVISDNAVQIPTPPVSSPDSTSYLLHALFSGSALAASLSNYEADTGTFYNALAEFELTFSNPGYFSGSPATLRRTSKTFAIQIERDLGEA